MQKEATASLALIKNTSVDVAVLAVLSEVEDVFALKEEQRMALKDFSEGNTF